MVKLSRPGNHKRCAFITAVIDKPLVGHLGPVLLYYFYFGYVSACQPGTFGKGCIYACNCYEDQTCDSFKGCLGKTTYVNYMVKVCSKPKFREVFASMDACS